MPEAFREAFGAVIFFHGSFRGSKFASTEASVEVSVEVTSVEEAAVGSFRGSNFRGSFHESFHGSDESFRGSRGSLHGSDGIFHGSFHELPPEMYIVQVALSDASYTWYEVRRCVFDCCFGRETVVVVRSRAAVC